MPKSGQNVVSTDVNFDPNQRLAIVAGGGELPEQLARHTSERGVEPYIFLIKGNAAPELRRFRHTEISAAEIGRLIQTLKAEKLHQLVLVGSIKSRPNWREFRFDWPTLRLMGSIISGMRSGDDALLSKLLRAIEQQDIKVFGIDQIMPELLMPNGVLAGSKPKKPTLESISVGLNAARKLGELDAGQGCVVIGQRIVALEGAEGTDAMLERVAQLRKEGRLSDRKNGVLVKVCKPHQDRRVDLPTIGVSTVKRAAAAKLQGIAVGAGTALVVNSDQLAQCAADNGLFVYGVPVDE